MSTVAELLIKLGMDDGGLDKGMASSQSKLKSWGENLRSVGTKLTAGVTLPLVGAGIAAINWASDVDQAIGKSEAVFGDQSKSVEEWSKTTANAYGFAQSESLAMASTYGSLFKVIGQTNEVAADQSMTLVGLAADMSAFNDVSNARASEALMAGLTGEYTSLKSMGIFLNEATINQEALTIAQADGRSEITEADKVQARYNTILKQTAQQQGQAARESKNFASQIQRVRAKIKDMGAAMGKMLMPYVLDFLENIQKLIDKFMDLDPKWQKIILAVAAFAAALGPVLIALGFMLPAFGALATVIGVLLSPIGLLIVALAALVAIGIYAWAQDLWGVRDAVSAIGEKLVSFAEGLDNLRKYIQFVWQDGDTLNDWLTHFPEFLRPAIQGIGDFVNALHDFTDALSGVAGDIGDVFQALGEGNWAEALYELRDAVVGFAEALLLLNADTVGLIADALHGLADKAGPLGPALDVLGDSADTLRQALMHLSGALGQIMAGDYSGALLTLGNAFAELIVASGEANRAVVYAMAGIAAAIAKAAPDKLRELADNMREVAAQGGPMSSALEMQAASADNTALGIENLRNAYENFKAGNYQDALLNLGNAFADLVVSSMQGSQSVVAAIADIGVYIVNWIASTDLVSGLTAKGGEIIQGLLTGIGEAWPFFQSWALGLPAAILGSISDMTTTLLQKGSDLLQGLLDGAAAKMPAVQAWLALVGAVALAAVGDVTASLLQKGKDLIQGLIDGLKDRWEQAKYFLSLVWTWARAAVGDVTSTLTQKGRDLIQGLIDGLNDRFETAKAWLSLVGPFASSAVGYLGGILYDAGSALMNGLWDGAKAVWDSLSSWLSEKKAEIAALKGPVREDAKVLIDNGIAIMQGFGVGLETGWGGIEQQLSGYTSDLSGAMNGYIGGDGMSTGNQPTIVVIQTLEPDRWARALADIDDAVGFARGFGTELGLYTGTP